MVGYEFTSCGASAVVEEARGGTRGSGLSAVYAYRERADGWHVDGAEGEVVALASPKDRPHNRFAAIGAVVYGKESQ